MDQAVSGINTSYRGMDISYLMTGRSYFIDFGWPTYLPMTESCSMVFAIRLGFYYKPWIKDKLSFGYGMQAATNMYFESSGSGDLRVNPTRVDAYPALLFSYLSPRLEIDLSATGISFYASDTYAYSNAVTLLAGPRGRLDMRYFFGLRPGIRLALEYQHMWNIDQEQRDSGLGAVDTFRMLNFSVCMVYRFYSLHGTGPLLFYHSAERLYHVCILPGDRGDTPLAVLLYKGVEPAGFQDPVLQFRGAWD